MADAKPSSPGAAWGAPLARFDAAWQKLESRLCAAGLVAEISAIALWVLLKGLASDYVPGGNAAGVICRNIISATVLGLAAHALTRSRAPRVQQIAVTVAVLVGLGAGRAWAHVGVLWASNMLNWLQNASLFMLIGGLRGLVTRLTVWVALIGASLATSRGKHIHVDVLLRYVPVKLQAPTAIAGFLAAALMCSFGVVGFVDYIAIAKFRAPAMEPCPGDPSKSCDTTAGQRLGAVAHALSADLFLVGRQTSLDFKSFPHVMAGTVYDQWMSGAEWNAWLDSADWTAHFDKTAVDALHVDAALVPTRAPAVVVPGTGEEVHGLLGRELNFVFPFGLAVIAIKFLLRALLTLAGRVSADPEAAYVEEDLHAHDGPAAV